MGCTARYTSKGCPADDFLFRLYNDQRRAGDEQASASFFPDKSYIINLEGMESLIGLDGDSRTKYIDLGADDSRHLLRLSYYVPQHELII